MNSAEAQGASPRAWREVVLNGRTCRVAGDAQDRYFADAQSAARDLARLVALGRAVLPQDGVVVDAGANIGLSALALAPLVPRGRIFAFEPVPTTADHLRATISGDGLANIECIESGVGAVQGSAAIHVREGFAAGSHIVGEGHAMGARMATIAVPVTTIDAFVAERGLERVDLMKIDVEGFEAEVIEGAAETLTRFCPVVHLEMNSFCLMSLRNQNPRQFVELLIDRFAHVMVLPAQQAPRRIRRGPLLHRFLHDHLVVHRGVQDLVCCMDDSWLARRPAPV